MPEKHLFEYAVIRLVPRVEREEFLNVGVIVYCPAQQFLQTLFELNATRLHTFSKNVNLPELHERLRAFERISAGGPDAGPIGGLRLPERFRWLTAARSTVVQTSPVHTGLCLDAGQTLTKLFSELVG